MAENPLAQLAARTDCALWKPSATAAEVEAFCAVAARQKIRAVCVTGCRVELASAQLDGSGVKVVALVGFPLGAMDSDAKRFETEAAIDSGAQEIELVLNAGWLRDGPPQRVLRELRDVAEAAEERPVCVAIETHLLAPEEQILACHLVLDSGAQCVATGSGFWPEGRAKPESVKLLREAVGPKFGVKAAAGAVDAAAAAALFEAGASRLGTSAA
jgi:deoxyribose-phosphate aldolase